MNPYRMPKPSAGILFKGDFCYADHKGRIDDRAGVARIRLTSEYLWVNDNLSIPVASVLHVGDVNGKAVSIVFHNALSDVEEGVILAGRNWFGLRDRGRSYALVHRLEEARRHAPPLEQFAERIRDQSGELKLGCEVCGAKPANELEFGWFFCFGVFPIAGAYQWKPERRFCCAKHGARACFVNNLVTGLVGYLGFPGVLVAPYRVWRNVREMNKVFGWNTRATVLNTLVGFILPAAAVGGLVYFIATR